MEFTWWHIGAIAENDSDVYYADQSSPSYGFTDIFVVQAGDSISSIDAGLYGAYLGNFDYQSTQFEVDTYNSPPADGDHSLLANDLPAPTIEYVTMETVADKLLQKLTTKAKADEHLYIRGEVNGNQMHATSVDELRSDNAKNKKAIVKLNILDELKSDGTKTNKKKLMSHSVYGYMIKMPETFNGTIIQQIELTTTAWTVVDPTKAIKSSRSSVEAFYLKKGATDLDLHTANRSFDPAIVKKAEFVYKMKIGAGTYNGEGVTEFKILEKNDKSNKIAGLVNFTGATKEITVTITIDSEGNKSITGPWTE